MSPFLIDGGRWGLTSDLHAQKYPPTHSHKCSFGMWKAAMCHSCKAQGFLIHPELTLIRRFKSASLSVTIDRRETLTGSSHLLLLLLLTHNCCALSGKDSRAPLRGCRALCPHSFSLRLFLLCFVTRHLSFLLMSVLCNKHRDEFYVTSQ